MLVIVRFIDEATERTFTRTLRDVTEQFDLFDILVEMEVKSAVYEKRHARPLHLIKQFMSDSEMVVYFRESVV